MPSVLQCQGSSGSDWAMPGWSHKPVWDRHLLSHWIHQNFTFEPACCFSTFTFALHSFKKTLSSPCYFSVGQWVALCQMCPQIIGEGLFTRMLLFCTIVITIKALSQHLGILPLCNVSNHDSETFTQRAFMHPQTVVVSYLLVPLRADHGKGFFSSQVCSGHLSRCNFTLIICTGFFFLHLEIKTNHIFLCHRCFVKIN